MSKWSQKAKPKLNANAEDLAKRTAEAAAMLQNDVSRHKFEVQKLILLLHAYISRGLSEFEHLEQYTTYLYLLGWCFCYLNLT